MRLGRDAETQNGIRGKTGNLLRLHAQGKRQVESIALRRRQRNLGLEHDRLIDVVRALRLAEAVITCRSHGHQPVACQGVRIPVGRLEAALGVCLHVRQPQSTGGEVLADAHPGGGGFIGKGVVFTASANEDAFISIITEAEGFANQLTA